MCITVCVLGSPTREAEKMEKVKQDRLLPAHIPLPPDWDSIPRGSLEASVLE